MPNNQVVTWSTFRPYCGVVGCNIIHIHNESISWPFAYVDMNYCPKITLHCVVYIAIMDNHVESINYHGNIPISNNHPNLNT